MRSNYCISEFHNGSVENTENKQLPTESTIVSTIGISISHIFSIIKQFLLVLNIETFAPQRKHRTRNFGNLLFKELTLSHIMLYGVAHTHHQVNLRDSNNPIAHNFGIKTFLGFGTRTAANRNERALLQ